MTTIAVRTERDRKQALKMVQGSELPFTLTKIKGAARSIEQNKLQRLWMRELEEQGDMRAEEYRAYSKAYFGVPILLAENDAFADQYTAIVKPLPYDQKQRFYYGRVLICKSNTWMMYIHTGLARATC